VGRGVWGVGCRVWGVGCEVSAVRCRIESSRYRGQWHGVGESGFVIRDTGV